MFWIFFGFFLDFFGIFGENFLGGIVLEYFFGRNFLGDIFWCSMHLKRVNTKLAQLEI
jgi:hypothetical protein